MSRAMTDEEYVGLRTLAKQAENVERVRMSLEHQVGRFTADGWPEQALVWSTSQVPELTRIGAQLKRQCGKVGAGTYLGDWAASTHGIGDALFFTVGLMPPLTDFATVSKVWKYCGLDVSDGQAPRRKAGEFSGFNTRLRSYVLMRLADPCVKQRRSPYRALYDARKAHTMETHPEMLTAGAGCPSCDEAYRRTKASRDARNLERERTAVGFDCSRYGGIHWTPKHRHADALRVVGKAILRDAWRVSRGMAPLAVTVPAVEGMEGLAA